MKILIAGVDGYIGTALYYELLSEGHTVCGFDNGIRDKNVISVGAESIIEKVIPPHERIDACDYEELKRYISEVCPDTIIWLAEQPSAPFSMISQEHAQGTIANNQIGSINLLYAVKEVDPNIHIIKLGTEGEYPDWIWDGKVIPEGGRMNVFLEGEDWEIPTPRYFGSWYHFTKFAESYMMDYANRIWGLTITDVNQGIVYGYKNWTRLDVDYYFGTVVHRFVAQAVSQLPLTVFGSGAQTRGMIALQDSLKALQLLTENPPKSGELRVIHQTGEAHSVLEVASLVSEKTGAEIKFIENPRVEKESNYFTFDTSTLKGLGLKPHDIEPEIDTLIDVMKNANIKKETLMPSNYAKWV